MVMIESHTHHHSTTESDNIEVVIRLDDHVHKLHGQIDEKRKDSGLHSFSKVKKQNSSEGEEEECEGNEDEKCSASGQDDEIDQALGERLPSTRGKPFKEKLWVFFKRHQLELITIPPAILITFVGALIVMAIEGPLNSDPTALPTTVQWNFLNAMYFMTVTLCAIGYGDYVMQTAAGRAFICVWIFIGVPILAIATTAVKTIIVSSAKGTLHLIDTNCKVIKSLHGPRWELVFALILFVVYLLGGAAIFMALEGWSYGVSTYYCTITLMMIGFGDVSPATDGGKIFFIFYAWLGLGEALYFIGGIAGILKKPIEQAGIRAAKLAKAKTFKERLVYLLTKYLYVIIALPMVAFVILMGGFLMYIIEGGAYWLFTPGIDAPVVPGWSYLAGVYWATTTITTVGYGAFTPVTGTGMAFAAVFAVIALVTIGYVVAVTQSIVIRNTKAALHVEKVETDNDPSNDVKPGAMSQRKKEAKLRCAQWTGYRLIAIAFVVLWVHILVGAAVFQAVDSNNDVDFGTGIYWAIVSASTVGYGDYSPENDTSYILFIFYAIAGIFVAVFIFGTISMVLVERTVASYRKKQKEKKKEKKGDDDNDDEERGEVSHSGDENDSESGQENDNDRNESGDEEDVEESKQNDDEESNASQERKDDESV